MRRRPNGGRGEKQQVKSSPQDAADETGAVFDEYKAWMATAAFDRPRRCIKKPTMYDDRYYEEKKRKWREARKLGAADDAQFELSHEDDDEDGETEDEASLNGDGQLATVIELKHGKDSGHATERPPKPSQRSQPPNGKIALPHAHLEIGSLVQILTGAHTAEFGVVENYVRTGWYTVKLSRPQKKVGCCSKRGHELKLVKSVQEEDGSSVASSTRHGAKAGSDEEKGVPRRQPHEPVSISHPGNILVTDAESVVSD